MIPTVLAVVDGLDGRNVPEQLPDVGRTSVLAWTNSYATFFLVTDAKIS
jgi:hypothetical protein